VKECVCVCVCVCCFFWFFKFIFNGKVVVVVSERGSRRCMHFGVTHIMAYHDARHDPAAVAASGAVDTPNAVLHYFVLADDVGRQKNARDEEHIERLQGVDDKRGHGIEGHRGRIQEDQPVQEPPIGRG
jgi:hypothetical protein